MWVLTPQLWEDLLTEFSFRVEAIDLFPHPDENATVIQQLLRARHLPDRPARVSSIEAPCADRLRAQLIDHLVETGCVRTPRVEEAMRTIPRHLFLPNAPLVKAYGNAPVDTKFDGSGRSISCASHSDIVTMMLEQLDVQPGQKILELGAGTGFNAGVLGYLVGEKGHVTTIDVDQDIVAGARSGLAAAGIHNVDMILGDGALGHAPNAPYDRIEATVGAHGVPHAWLDQLAPGGRLLTPLRLRGSVSRSIAFENQDGAWRSVGSQMNTFMPMRKGIADDPRVFVPLDPDHTVTLITNGDQKVDADALSDIFRQPRTEAWTDVTFRGPESAEYLELWLACAMPNAAPQTGDLMEPQGQATLEQAHQHFAAEVARWREVRGMSKKVLAERMGFHPSYVSHMESGRTKPSEDFAWRADETLNAGKAIWHLWCEYETARLRSTKLAAVPAARKAEQPYATGSSVLVEHDAARLDYDGSRYRLTMRRLLRNTGSEPITRYLIRISVDRYPGEPERSNHHYRANPLTWREINLAAVCRREAMRRQAKHDRDAFKEVWLLFDNDQGRFPLYPGESVWIEYAYTVSEEKWGHWFQRAVRLPTGHLEVELAFPTELDPAV